MQEKLIAITFFASLLFISCETEEQFESYDTHVNTKSPTSCNAILKNLVSHKRVIYQGTDQNDRIVVRENSSGLIISTKTGNCNISKPYDELIIYGNKGNDSIVIKPSVKVKAIIYSGDGSDFVKIENSVSNTIVSLGDGADKIIGNRKNTRFWVDPEDTHNASSKEKRKKKLHIVERFKNTNKILNGNDIEDPRTYELLKNTQNPAWEFIPIAETSLWGIDKPSPYDVQQGFGQTCPSTSFWSSLANQYPNKIREMAVELGDGTYAVQLINSEYVRVDQDFLPFNLSRPGPTGKSWYVIFEKAHGVFGYYNNEMPVRILDSSTIGLVIDFDSAEAYLNKLHTLLNQGKIVSFTSRYDNDINENGFSWSHFYSLLKIKDNKIILRNPYGDIFDGPWKPEYNPDLGKVVLTAEEVVNYFTGSIVNEVRFD